MKTCELCILHTIEHEFFKNDDFIVMSCMNCKIPMVVPFEHIDPNSKTHQDLRKKMLAKLREVAKDFYKGKPFFIDKYENKIPEHMHWHARPIKASTLRRFVRMLFSRR